MRRDQDQISEQEICKTIARSGMFDIQWYLAKYRDVATSQLDPILHYVRYGAKEGRKPYPEFIYNGTPVSSNPLYDEILNTVKGSSTQSEIPIIFACNEAYVPYLSVAIASLIANASNLYKYKIYILYCDISETSLDKLKSQSNEFISLIPVNVQKNIGTISKYGYVCGHLSGETYFRILIPELFSKYKTCIYLDCDIIINSSLHVLYNINIGDNLVGAIEDNWQDPEVIERRNKLIRPIINHYFNAGVLLINNELFIEEDIKDAFMKLLMGNIQFPCHDQDILNIICNNRTYKLHQTWNFGWQYFIKNGWINASAKVTHEAEECQDFPNIVHFSSDLKPWQLDDGHFSKQFWRYARLSPFYKFILKNCPYDPIQLMK